MANLNFSEIIAIAPVTTPPPNQLALGQSSNNTSAYFTYDGVATIEAFRALGFTLFERENLLICTSCKLAATPGQCIDHAKKEHQMKLKPSLITSFQAECVLRSMPAQAIHFKVPAPRQAPVPLLPIYTGITCTICDYSCLSIETMNKHFRIDAKHKDVANACEYIREQTFVQTLFRAPIRYFEVEPSFINSDVGDYLPVLFATVLPGVPTISVVPANTERDRTPFMRQFQFDVTAGDVICSKPQRELVKKLKAVPDAKDKRYLNLQAVMVIYLVEAGRISMTGPDNFIVRQHLYQGSSISPLSK